MKVTKNIDLLGIYITRWRWYIWHKGKAKAKQPGAEKGGESS